MENINAILLVVQVLLSVMLIALILLQHGKGADAGAAFGSGASGTIFGARGSGNFLTKATAILATLFFATSLGLAYIASRHEGPKSIVDSVVEEQAAKQAMEPTAPAALQAPAPADLPPADEPAAGETAPAAQGQGDLPPAE